MVRRDRSNLKEAARKERARRQASLTPSDHLRMGPLREGAFKSELHSTKNAAWLGFALLATFSICFITGLISHGIQNPPDWFEWPSRPVWLYRFNQSIHVASGIASIPLLLAKLWTAYPRLYIWPPLENAAHLVERVSLVGLVGGSLFMLVSGMLNISLWYPWRFSFPRAHFWMAWITIGSLIVHVGAKWATAVAAVKGAEPTEGRSTSAQAGLAEAELGVSRRGFLRAVFATSGLVTLTTIGQTFAPLRGIGLLAPRDPKIGPQGFPVNKTAISAGVTDLARSPDWRLKILHGTQKLTLTREELLRMPQHEVVLPISCVEGWSAEALWRGVRVSDLLRAVGARPGAEVLVESLQPRGSYRSSKLSASHAWDPDTLIALEVNGEALHIDHGFPARLVGPNRPGVMQTKWIDKLVIV